MERFMNIFKLEEVERFVKMRHEGTLEQVTKHLRDNQAKMKDEVIMPEILKGVKGIDQRMTDKFDEMAEVVYSMILAAPKQERKDFIEKFLPLNSDMFVEALEEDGETSSSQKGNPDD